MNDPDFPEIQALLKRYNQDHLLQFVAQLTDAQSRALLSQIHGIDFSLLNTSAEPNTCDSVSRAERAAAPQSVIHQPNSAEDHQIRGAAEEIGCQLLRDGKVAVITVAGGQGSRLGFDHPKGLYPIGPKSERTLFQVFAEQILARRQHHNAAIPWYLMTSAATHDETVAFFEQKKFFGVGSDTVAFFQQASLPAIDAETGKILMDSPGSLCLSPDGHGGMVAALYASGCLGRLADAGVEHVFYHQVDNPTVILCDPVLIGLHHQQASQLTTNVVCRTDPAERMGVLVDIDGHTEIIEYSELSPEQSAARDENGQWIFWAGNTAIHVFRRDFLKYLTDGEIRLPLHQARKKLACIDVNGTTVHPQKRDAIKFERFIFDALPLAQRSLIVEGDRQREFNPVKNPDGNDSPQTSRDALSRIGREWLRAAGETVDDEAVVEISPLVALTSEQLVERLARGDITRDELVG